LVVRRHHNIAAVAMANRNARLAWALLSTGKAFESEHVQAPMASVLEAVTVPGELISFRPLEIGETAHATSIQAWFAGVGAMRRIEDRQG
jgi:hypothetical protein